MIRYHYILATQQHKWRKFLS